MYVCRTVAQDPESRSPNRRGWICVLGCVWEGGGVGEACWWMLVKSAGSLRSCADEGRRSLAAAEMTGSDVMMAGSSSTEARDDTSGHA